MPSPKWRKRSKVLRRARSPIMLSLNLPQILDQPQTAPRERRAHKKEARPAQKGGLKSAGPCQNHFPRATLRRAKTVHFGSDLLAKQVSFPVWLNKSQGRSRCRFRKPIDSAADMARTASS